MFQLVKNCTVASKTSTLLYLKVLCMSAKVNAIIFP